MILKLDHTDLTVAKEIYMLMQHTNNIELSDGINTCFSSKSNVMDILWRNTSFYGFFRDDSLLGFIEINKNIKRPAVNMLIENPNYAFLKIANTLLDFAEYSFGTESVKEETTTFDYLFHSNSYLTNSICLTNTKDNHE